MTRSYATAIPYSYREIVASTEFMLNDLTHRGEERCRMPYSPERSFAREAGPRVWRDARTVGCVQPSKSVSALHE